MDSAHPRADAASSDAAVVDAPGSGGGCGAQGEDDGTEVVPLAQWLERREGEKPLGVYGVYDAQGQLQYIGYSRNMVTTLRVRRAGGVGGGMWTR